VGSRPAIASRLSEFRQSVDVFGPRETGRGNPSSNASSVERVAKTAIAAECFIRACLGDL